MAAGRISTLDEALIILRKALDAYTRRRDDDVLARLALIKAFENAVEYSWRELKRAAGDEGLDVPSPKAAIRHAARLGWISDPERWMEMIEARNASVHDYFGISDSDFAELATALVSMAETLASALKRI